MLETLELGHYSLHETTQVIWRQLDKLRTIKLNRGALKKVTKLCLEKVFFEHGNMEVDCESFLYLQQEGVEWDLPSSALKEQVLSVSKDVL